jgi:RNA polymerase sigma-70 factor, ECF subfamily
VYLSRKDAVEQLSDGELVRRLLGGDQDAMAVIFDRYYRLVMSVALRILHDVGEAQDVVQKRPLVTPERGRL